MINQPFGRKRILRRDGSSVFSNAMFDRGQDPLNVFSVREHALRRDIGDIRFVERLSKDDLQRRIFLVPEFPSSNLYNEKAPVSVIGLSMNPYDFGSPSELDIQDSSYKILDWDSGLNFARELVNGRDDLLKSNLFSLLDRINKIPSSRLSYAEIRGKVGPETGARFEVGMIN